MGKGIQGRRRALGRHRECLGSGRALLGNHLEGKYSLVADIEQGKGIQDDMSAAEKYLDSPKLAREQGAKV